MKKKILSFFVYTIPTIFVLGILVIVSIYYYPKFSEWREQRRQEKIIEKYDKAVAELEQKRKNDTFGGKTPEETVEKFLSVLKTGDLELASKYYEMALQKKALTNLKEEKQKYGDISHTINYFEEVISKGIKGCANIDKDYGGCVYEFEIDIGIEEIGLSLNKFTNIWKITLPF